MMGQIALGILALIGWICIMVLDRPELVKANAPLIFGSLAVVVFLAIVAAIVGWSTRNL